MTAEVVLAGTPDEIADLPAEQRGQMITHALIESKQWLAVATKGTDPTPIAEFKAWAATVAEMTKQKGLAAEIQAEAQEMVRRAERGIGVAVRNGQSAGEIRANGQRGSAQVTYERVRNGNVEKVSQGAVLDETSSLASPGTFFGSAEERVDAYALTDGVSDEQFEEALTAARNEGNLSRANVVRNVKGVKGEGLTPVERLGTIRDLAPRGFTSGQIADEIGTTESYVRDKAREHGIRISADEVLRGTHRVRVDSNHIVNHAVMTLDGLVSGFGAIRFNDLDAAQAADWAASLTTSINALKRLQKQIKEMTQ